VKLTDNMVKAIAKQAEAERDRRAKVIHAEAEFQAAQTLTNAATILASVLLVGCLRAPNSAG
jgi:regulator of protease activity HflC (stomatin/prohibitin superfamily)